MSFLPEPGSLAFVILVFALAAVVWIFVGEVARRRNSAPTKTQRTEEPFEPPSTSEPKSLLEQLQESVEEGRRRSIQIRTNPRLEGDVIDPFGRAGSLSMEIGDSRMFSVSDVVPSTSPHGVPPRVVYRKIQQVIFDTGREAEISINFLRDLDLRIKDEVFMTAQSPWVITYERSEDPWLWPTQLTRLPLEEDSNSDE